VDERDIVGLRDKVQGLSATDPAAVTRRAAMANATAMASIISITMGSEVGK
jgi:hypothetical protein